MPRPIKKRISKPTATQEDVQDAEIVEEDSAGEDRR